MITIKRYNNRKLYNSAERQYISLDDLARLVRSGEEVRVLEHGTEVDITGKVLAQVISSSEKKGNFLAPLSILSRLIQAGDRSLLQFGEALQAFQNPYEYAENEIARRLQTLADEKIIDEAQHTWLGGLLLNPRWEESYRHAHLQEEASPEDLLLLEQKLRNLEEEIHKLQQDL